MCKKKTFNLPEIDVPEKYQPYIFVSLDRNHLERKEKLSKREEYLIRIGLVFGSIIGVPIGILLMYILHLVGWY